MSAPVPQTPDRPPAEVGSARRRDRRDRGMRGPAVLPGTGGPARRTGRDRFDAVVLGVAADLERRWGARLASVEYAVEDTPRVPPGWRETSVPLSVLVRPAGGSPARVVVFRRPVEHRAETRSELESLVLHVVVEQVAELLGLEPGEVDPRVADDPDEDG